MKRPLATRCAIHRVSRLCFPLLVLLLLLSTGCRLCCDDEDRAYAAYGGVWERTDRNQGRVGSVFDPGGARKPSLSDKVDSEVADAIQDRRQIDPLGQPDSDATPDDPSDKDSGLNIPDAESDQEFEDRMKRFEDENTMDINIVPGALVPPDVH
ncbi:hypothetical protein NHH03_01865 [Stieleria sp. TO1_6]|uniref:hypothetical protein n=1 Tax=Stieleria tagensis TaxID=2956795 RepID=UPI00209AFA2A|nr:hypothetical protein [Stieleria tagensis]MCO8120467.1 hypothetical protein [Stieleria tagensis]